MDSFYNQFNQSGDSQRLNQPNNSQQQGVNNQSRIPTQFNTPVSGGQHQLQNNSNSSHGVNYGSGHSQQQQQTQHVSHQQQQIHSSGGSSYQKGTDQSRQFQQQTTTAQPRPSASMYGYNVSAPSTVMQSQSSNANVPNPLGLGAPAPSSRTANQTALLKSMYHSGHQQQVVQQQASTTSMQAMSQQQQQMHSQQMQQQQQSQRSTSMSPIITSPQLNHSYYQQNHQNIQYQQPAQSNAQGYQNTQNYGYNVQSNQQYNSSRATPQQNGSFQVTGQVHQPRHTPIQQQGQMSNQMLMQQQQQQQRQVQQHAQVQVQQQRQQYPSQQAQVQQQQGYSQQLQQHHQSQSGSSQSSSQKQKFNLTDEAKRALRDAVLSAIRNNGEIDPVLLQRAMAQGLPQQAILNAARVARERDKRNREEREKKRLAAAQQQSLQQQPQGIIYPNTNAHEQRTIQYQNQTSQQQRQAQFQQIANMQLQNKRELEKAAAEASLRDRQAEEAKKKRELQLAQQREVQRRQMEDNRKRKESEALRLAAEAEAKRNAALTEKIKPWSRSSFALVVGQGSKGAEVKSHPYMASRMVHPNSTCGGTSLCDDDSPALVVAYERRLPKQAELEGKVANVPEEKIKHAANTLREKLIKAKPELYASLAVKDDAPPPSPIVTPAQSRKRRLADISKKLIGTHPMKRIKLQPKREGRFLDKHIKRARTMTADSIAKRHKDLLKAITSHQTEFYKFHKSKKTEAARLARSIRDQLKKAEIQKEKDADQAERARIAALKSNDMTAYTALLEDTKNERLKFLLDKTDECMNQISNLLSARAEEEQADSLKSGREMDPSFSEMVPVSGNYYETAHVKSEQVRQPSILTGGDLKEYQLSGLQWLVSLYNNRLNGILADEMGLGKTIQTISLIAYLMEMKENPGPYLVIVPLSTLSNWVNEFAKWLPAASVICYKGTPNQRRDIFRNEVMGHFNVLLTTYEFVIRDKSSLKKLEWQYAIVDEGHRMKNNQSKFAVTLGTQYTTKRRVLLTGTPLQNSLPELWALLNFLLPAIFNSAETFDQWFNKPFSSFGKSGSGENADTSEELLSNEERMLVIHRLHELLRPFMLRRVKSEVLDQLPDKVEKVLRCELSSWQKELYKQISTKIIGEAQGKNFNRGLNNVVMQLRKVCNHPFLFSKEGYHINDDIIRSSGKFELLDRILPKLKAAGHRVLMFTQMVKMMPILEDYFAYRGHRSIRLDGSTTADEREKRMYMYNSPDSPYFIFLLSTRAGGLGLNLATADTVIIFDSDWNPMMDLQAQDRAHRIGQRNDVRVFRLITQSPVEEKILGRAAEKLRMNELVVEAGKFDKSGQDEEEGSSLERLKMMELLLTDFDGTQYNQSSSGLTSEDDDKDTDDGQDDDGDGGDVLNEMISSNDIDLQLYSKMDLSGAMSVPSLYSDVESVPDWIRYPNGKPEEGSELLAAAADVTGKRKAAQGVVYDDGMTEKQFCRMMDKNSIAAEKEKKGRKKKRSRNAVDPSLIIDDFSERKRAKVGPLDPNTSTTRKKPTAISENAPVTADVNERLVSICRSLIYFKEKGTGRKMSDIFLEKPCPTTYPDYYQLIEKPIGMNDILRKCRANLYSTIKEFSDDWNTLFANAATYNGEGSWVALDANTLKAEFTRLIEKNTTKEEPPKKPESAKKLASANKAKKPLRIKLSLKKAPPKTEAVKDEQTYSDGGSDSEY